MPTYPESQLELIDSRVRLGMARLTKMGTVAWRSSGSLAGDPGMYAASVVFDGSSGTAQPVKCFESVIVDIGDRVGVVRFESEWIIVSNYTLRTLGDASYEAPGANGGTTASATYVDMPGSPSAILNTKYRDDTLLRISMGVSMYSTAVTTIIEIAAYVASTDGSIAYDQRVIKFGINPANEHTDATGWTTSAPLPGGVGYAVTGRWRRVSGTGTMTTDGNDHCYIRVEEVVS
jgi:hypothetical protein